MATCKLSEIEESIESICENRDLELSGQTSSLFDLQPMGMDLKKILVQVTGQKDIENVTRVKIKAVTRQAGLHRLADYTPRLKVLILDGSCVNSLRDFGSSLKLLETLSVARCNLKSLDGLWGFRVLSTLVASDNSITNISPCSGVEKLEILDLTNNEIADLSSFVFLQNCKNLRVLDVAGNRFDNYKDIMMNLVPQIRVLDGEEIKMSESSIEGRESSDNESDVTSEDEDLIVFSEDEDQNVSLSLKKDSEDSSANEYENLKPPPLLRELGAGDEGSIGSSVNEHYVKFIDDDETTLHKEKIALESLSSSIYLMTHEFDTISMFDLSSNVGDYHRSLEIMPSKLSSGRPICGNLAASLRSRNIKKNPFTISAPRASLSNVESVATDNNDESIN